MRLSEKDKTTIISFSDSFKCYLKSANRDTGTTMQHFKIKINKYYLSNPVFGKAVLNSRIYFLKQPLFEFLLIKMLNDERSQFNANTFLSFICCRTNMWRQRNLSMLQNLC